MGVEQGGDYFDGDFEGGGDYGDIGLEDFNYGYGAGGESFVVDPGFGLPPDNVSPDGSAIAWGDIGAGDDFNYGYGADSGSSGGDLFNAYLDYYIELGYSPLDAVDLAAQQAEAGSILTPTYEQGLSPTLPNTSLPDYSLPTYYNYWESPPYVPTFPDLPAPTRPLPESPASSQPNLPPACGAGTYHPYPIGHPQQNICVPFPEATTNAPKPPTATATGSTSSKPPAQQKPPQQQQCPQGYYRASNGQCLPIPRCTTPGTVFDVRSGRCVPSGQSSAPGCPPGEWFNPQTRRCEVAPLCTTPGTVFDVHTGMCVPPDQLTSGEDIFGGLKNIPWWVWLAAAGLFLLGRDDEGGGRTTTVRYRRAT